MVGILDDVFPTHIQAAVRCVARIHERTLTLDISTGETGSCSNISGVRLGMLATTWPRSGAHSNMTSVV